MIEPSGFVAEADMITQIQQGLSRSPDIISLSAGGHTRNDVPPLGLQELWTQRLSQQGGVVLVAAAGNQGTARPFWPAAFEWAVGVGSMSPGRAAALGVQQLRLVGRRLRARARTS